MADPGLCGSCRHCRPVESARGADFWLCERSRTEASYPKYPRLPVLHCVGYEAKATDGEEER